MLSKALLLVWFGNTSAEIAQSVSASCVFAWCAAFSGIYFCAAGWLLPVGIAGSSAGFLGLVNYGDGIDWHSDRCLPVVCLAYISHLLHPRPDISFMPFPGSRGLPVHSAGLGRPHFRIILVGERGRPLGSRPLSPT